MNSSIPEVCLEAGSAGAKCRQVSSGSAAVHKCLCLKPEHVPACSVLPQDARPAPVVSLQRVGFAAWARGPTLLVATADCRVCIYRRAALPCMRRPGGPVAREAWLPEAVAVDAAPGGARC